ncbi:hypothetical protein [Paenibacillus nasutitermitis]|uniref:Uncharacterized protein n=1 Tax=Paenibacillus nasutitermitis TaxID=1652958 RepID=A0A916Z4R6_9BACL|nr:hypothetical protein [Paenibacillus nasutitermitis]GGD73646.1 hypothetical protein GCM10010911_34380 [Paenibacillus nasutitermitis]
MNIKITNASMTHDSEEGYKGHVSFEVEGHKHPYEVTLLTKKGKMWDYSLSFGKESGSEEEIFAVEKALEEDDELFDLIVEAAEDSLEQA